MWAWLFWDLCFPTWILKLACQVSWNEFGGIFIRIVLKLGWLGDNLLILILHFYEHIFEISFHHIIPPLPLTIGVILLLPLSSSFLNNSCSGLTDIFPRSTETIFQKHSDYLELLFSNILSSIILHLAIPIVNSILLYYQ